MISRRAIAILVTCGCVLPLALVVVLGVSRLLLAMQDTNGAVVLDRVALALGIVWAVDLLCLILALGVNSLGPPGAGGGAE